MNFDNSDIRKQVLDFIAKLGIEPYDESEIIFDGVLHRFRTRDDKPGDKSGAICIYTDGWPAGFVQDWRKGIKEYWKYDTSGLDEEQRKYFNSDEYRKKCEKREREAAEKRRRAQRRASEAAARLWERLPEAPRDHPYLLRKNLTWFNRISLRYNPNTKCLAVPLKDINGRVLSIQWIPEEGHKMFFEGAGLDGAFWECWLEGMQQNPKGVILLGEGFATMAKVFLLAGKPVAAAMSCYKLERTAKIIRTKYPDAKIIITADNDHQTERKHGTNPGILYASSLKKSLMFGKPIADGVIYPEFKEDEDGSDWDDFAIIHGNGLTTAKLINEINKSLMPDNIRCLIEQQRIQTVNAQELRSKVFQPIKWAVPGMIPSGLSILGGGPKVGKSMLALQLSLAVAIGGYAFGKIKVEQGDVLYLALEDNERRLQERIESSNAVSEDDDISRLTLAYTVPRQHEGGLSYIEWWTKEYAKSPRLVIIDTFQKFRKQLSNKANVYAEDYDVLSEIKHIADMYDIAILILHHLKKVNPKNELLMDWIDLFSGSAGISGSADALFLLKRARQDVHGKLFRTGRDVEEKEFWLKLDGFGWCLEDADVESFVLPTWKKQILDFLKTHPVITPMELATGYDLSVNTARQNLARLAKEELIIKTGYGQYKLPEQSKD